MDTDMRNLILATASVLVIGIGGTAMSHAADLGKTAPHPSWNTPANSGASQHPQAAANWSVPMGRSYPTSRKLIAIPVDLKPRHRDSGMAHIAADSTWLSW